MLELWGGHECTVNRVGGLFSDQTRRTGHEHRIDDLDLFADLGLKALRYPVLWERLHGSGGAGWLWTDARLRRIQTLGMRTIAGLLHHGGGPAHTDLLDDGFAVAFAGHAQTAARRYPWILEWTPINEPLTTARFCALYGHWHPHVADERAFWRALLNQVDATRLAMREIRAVQPAAQLIQTEDIGRAYATGPMATQAEFDNARRWMTWDLLAGRVVPGHRLYRHLSKLGLADRLKAIADDPCPADILGVNHYLTSDRFLDHRTLDYPAQNRGGNGSIAYADVEAVRTVVPGPDGLEGALQETWARYGRPIAVTESYNHCTREEQVRWLREAWKVCGRLNERGVDVRAVTAWALLGSYDWSSLLTKADGRYEVGAFDVRADPPRATALAAEIKRLGGGQGQPHPATLGPGWWRRDIRLQHRPVFRSVQTPQPRLERRTPYAAYQPLLIVGASLPLGQAFARACEWRGVDYTLVEAPVGGWADDQVCQLMDRDNPWGAIDATSAPTGSAPGGGDVFSGAPSTWRLAEACRDRGVAFASFSTDQVFDGLQATPYREGDPTTSLTPEGLARIKSERVISDLGGPALIVRTAALFSAYDQTDVAGQLAQRLQRGEAMVVPDDILVSPTHVPDLVDAVLDLLIDGEAGVRHLTQAGSLSWFAFAKAIATVLGLDSDLIQPRAAAALESGLKPGSFHLGTDKGLVMDALDAALDRYAAARRDGDPSLAAKRLLRPVATRRAALAM